MNRQDFLELLLGIAGGLGIPGAVPGVTYAEERGQEAPITLEDDYLVQGLTGMARAKGWFDAHWGAGILAGYYLCRDNALGKATTAAIQRQMDTVLRSRGSQFVPFPEEPAEQALIDEVPKALPSAMEGGLRAHGHAVIFASLSTRALRDAPQMAQPTIIQGLCRLSQRIATIPPERPLDPAFVYADPSAMIEALLDNLVRFQGLLGHPSVRRPNYTHMVTHTEALWNLEAMGYTGLAKLGHAGLHTQFRVPVPVVEPRAASAGTTAGLRVVMDERFWNDKVNQERWRRRGNIADNPNGDWIAAGHLFKVLYSYHRLIARVQDEEKVRLCSAILLERYLHPEVQGG